MFFLAYSIYTMIPLHKTCFLISSKYHISHNQQLYDSMEYDDL